MISLLRTYLRPYRGSLALVVILLLIGAVGTLYLPDLNADIINNGIVAGNNDYIISTGALMLGVTLLLGIASILAVFFGARASMGFGRDVRIRVETVQHAQARKRQVAKHVLGDEWRSQQQHHVRRHDCERDCLARKSARCEQHGDVARAHHESQGLKARGAKSESEPVQRSIQPARPAAVA